ncbi:hypothetical protein [Peptoniphilus asaccharolyticus]
MIAPCKNCEEREVGCHSNCKRYIEYDKTMDHIRDSRKKLVELEGYITTETTKNTYGKGKRKKCRITG